MHSIEKSIEVDVPIRTAYNQWTQFEEFPLFMENVDQVEQLDDTHLRWVATISGKRKEWDAEIVEQVPEEVVSWRSTSGMLNNGSVTFQRIDDERCRINVIMTYAPDTAVEKIADWLGVLSAQVEADLRRFKKFIEERQVETGGWRGKVREGGVREPDPKSRPYTSAGEPAFGTGETATDVPAGSKLGGVR